jgi:hypothetical protein
VNDADPIEKIVPGWAVLGGADESRAKPHRNLHAMSAPVHFSGEEEVF